MKLRQESGAEAYDVIVVGGGMGGLSAGALLAKAGKKVLVVERHDRPGGYAHSFQRGKYHFDVAVHTTSHCESVGPSDRGIIDSTLRFLGARDRCSFLPIKPYYASIFPDLTINVSTGIPEFIEAHAERFPDERRALRELMRLHTRINREDSRLPSDLSSHSPAELAEKLPLLCEYQNATLGQVMDQYLTDPRLKAAFATLWVYLGLPPSRLSFISWATMLVSVIHTGVFYCQGGFHNLVSAYVDGLEKQGGELLLRSRVRRIMVTDRRVEGVVLDDGERIRAPVVISNADATQTFEELVGLEHLPKRFVKYLRGLKPSLSAVTVYIATSLDMAQMGAAHGTFLYSTYDHDAAYRDLLGGTKPSGIMMSVPTITDPSLAPPGEHLVTLTTLVPYHVFASWRDEKERFTQMMLDIIEARFPGFRAGVKFVEGGSPRTMERYTLNLAGAIYGWEQSPEQTGMNRMDHRTPIQGLYLSGHWTRPGGGVMSVIVSGLQTAQLILGYPEIIDFLRAMEAKRV